MFDSKPLAQQLSRLDSDGVVLVEVGTEDATEAALASAKCLVEKGAFGIILSADRPYSKLVQLYKGAGVDSARLFFIDCVSKAAMANPPKADNVAYVDGAGDLTRIAITITAALDAAKGRRFLLVDSVSTFLVYEKPGVFFRFIHAILTRLRISDANGVLFLEPGTDRLLRAEIVQLCDKVIKA